MANTKETSPFTMITDPYANLRLSDYSRIPLSSFQASMESCSKILACALGFMVPISTSFTQVILILLMISWILSGNFKAKLDIILRHPISVLSIVLFGMFAFGSLYTIAEQKEMKLLLWKMSKLLYIPFLLPLMLEEKWRRYALFSFLAAMFLTLILAFLKLYGGVPIPSRYTAACVFKNHIDTNLMMAFSAFIIGHYLMFDKKIKPSPSHDSITYGLYALLALLCFYIFWMSEGRSGHIIFIGLWVLFCWQRFSLKHFAIGIIALLFLITLVGLGSNRFQTRVNALMTDVIQFKAGETDTSFGLRLEYMKESFELAKKAWLKGYGTGSFNKVYENHAIKKGIKITTNPHNEYLNVLLQLGVIGLCGLLALFLGLFILSFKLPLLEQYLIQGVVIAMGIGSFGNSWLMDFTSGYFFVMISAFCFGALPLFKKN